MKKVLFKIIKYAVLILFAVFIVYPVFVVVMSSFKTTAEIYQDTFGLPSKLNFSSYVTAWVNGNLSTYYVNSVIITFVSIFFVVVLASFASFAITREDCMFKKVLYGAFVAGISIPYQVGILPLYLQMSKLNLVNNRLGLILIYVAFGLPFSVFVMSGFFRTIPKDIEESAIIDGCNNYQIYAKIVVPLSPTVITTVVIFELVTIWNDMFFPLIFISSKDLRTIPIGLLSFKGEFISNYPAMFAGVVIASLPLIIAYLLLQKQFIEGLTAGAVKG
ncbi:MAG TPA: carbohydrate ABC transporter permease [Clostridiaceae bacterium]|nr:carbohydrate ABC transporter permease [Clostridiaceae bacterium]